MGFRPASHARTGLRFASSDVCRFLLWSVFDRLTRIPVLSLKETRVPKVGVLPPAVRCLAF